MMGVPTSRLPQNIHREALWSVVIYWAIWRKQARSTQKGTVSKSKPCVLNTRGLCQVTWIFRYKNAHAITWPRAFSWFVEVTNTKSSPPTPTLPPHLFLLFLHASTPPHTKKKTPRHCTTTATSTTTTWRPCAKVKSWETCAVKLYKNYI